MSARILWLPLAVGLAAGAQPEPVGAPIVIYTSFQRTPPTSVSDSIRSEVGGILGHAGIELRWHALADAQLNENSPDLAVIHLRGRCDVAGLFPHQNEPGALGWTYLSNGAVLPFADVDCDRVRSFIQVALLGVPSAQREHAFGRAVGRVLAHELYHILTRDTRHGAKGVAKSEYTVRDLLSDDFVFDESESEELRVSQPHL